MADTSIQSIKHVGCRKLISKEAACSDAAESMLSVDGKLVTVPWSTYLTRASAA
jgi:hypothetical protein